MGSVKKWQVILSIREQARVFLNVTHSFHSTHPLNHLMHMSTLQVTYSLEAALALKRAARSERTMKSFMIDWLLLSIWFLLSWTLKKINGGDDIFLGVSVLYRTAKIILCENGVEMVERYSVWFNLSVLYYLNCYFSWNISTVYRLSNQPILFTPNPPMHVM